MYEQIIEKVIAASRNDFEEMGVDNNTLEELKQVCGDLSLGPGRSLFPCIVPPSLSLFLSVASFNLSLAFPSSFRPFSFSSSFSFQGNRAFSSWRTRQPGVGGTG